MNLYAAIRIKGDKNSKARVIFENRSIPVNGGVIYDHLAPFGSQVYLIDLNLRKMPLPVLTDNLLKDPGFEDISSPGVPSACYARPGGDRGATYFLDTREHHEGNHSVRILTPDENKSITFRFFPFQVKAGILYNFSLGKIRSGTEEFLMQQIRIMSVYIT